MADVGEIVFSVKLENPEEAAAMMQEAVDELEDQLALDMWEALRALLQIIKEDYVPVDTGALRDSGYIEAPTLGDDGFEIELGFTEDYALIQHERLDYSHRHGQAKYLEQPLMEFLDNPNLESR